jgi:hypothetical protein
METLVLNTKLMHPKNDITTVGETHRSTKKRCRTFQSSCYISHTIFGASDDPASCETTSKRQCQRICDRISNQLLVLTEENDIDQRIASLLRSKPSSLKRHKHVSFKIEKNIAYCNTFSKEEMKRTWLSIEEHVLIRGEIIETLNGFRVGVTNAIPWSSSANQGNGYCTRGLEQYVTLEKSREKFRNRTIHTRMTLFKYRFELYQNLLQKQQKHQQQQIYSSSNDAQYNLFTTFEVAQFASRINDVFGSLQNAATMLRDYVLKLEASTQKDTCKAYEIAKQDEQEIMQYEVEQSQVCI